MDETKNNSTEQQDRMVELGADLSKNSRGNIYTLTIIGQIEGHQVLPETTQPAGCRPTLYAVFPRPADHPQIPE